MEYRADEGYFFGMGAFETIAVEQGKPQLLVEHMKRLKLAMNFFGIDFDENKMLDQVEKFLEENKKNLTGRDVLKITKSKENEVLSLRKNSYKEEDYERGFHLTYSSILRNETSPLTYHKTLNYADNLMEKRRVKREGKDEAIFLNTKGEIAEGCTTNLFFQKNNIFYTPPISCGMLPGIMRRFICENYTVVEKVIFPNEIEEYEKIFCTNSLLGMMPAKLI